MHIVPAKVTAPLKRPRQERAQQTVRAILEAAVQVFEQHGYTSGTTARIAERAGVSVGSLYQYFPNKMSVLNALAEQHLAEKAAFAEEMLRVAQLPGVSLAFALERMVEGFLSMHLRSPTLHRILVDGGLMPPAVQEKIHQLRVHYRNQVALLLSKHPEVRRADFAVLAYFVLENLEHFTHQLAINPPPPAIGDAAVPELTRLLLRYLQP